VIIAASLTNRDGDVRRLEINAAASRDLHDEVAEIRWLLFDRTKRARREERRRRRAAELESLVAERTAELRREQALKDNLLATVSHEFRTALTAIGGYAELLQLGVHGALNEAQTSDVKRISQAYGHLTSVVEDLLSYANLSAGMLAIEPTEILLSDVLNGLADLVAPQATARRVAVGIEPVDSRLVVRADPERLRQVLLNLLANAVKFSAQGGNVRVRCGVDVEAITIEVADDGEGIPPDARDRIFEPFVRLRTRSGAAGTGLGLAISRDLMRAMGGDVVLADSTVQGSCFVIRLPRSTPLAQQSSTA
jgi:signal transduction histidine kinase